MPVLKNHTWRLGRAPGGTGILPVRVRRLEAYATKGVGRDAPPTTFHDLRMSPRLMRDC
jgi:hypothetical protein